MSGLGPTVNVSRSAGATPAFAAEYKYTLPLSVFSVVACALTARVEPQTATSVSTAPSYSILNASVGDAGDE